MHIYAYDINRQIKFVWHFSFKHITIFYLGYSTNNCWTPILLHSLTDKIIEYLPMTHALKYSSI